MWIGLHLNFFETQEGWIQERKETRDQEKSHHHHPLIARILEPPTPLGLTLIELILILLIIGILAVVAIPKVGIDINQKSSIDGAAYMIASDIRYAQECAMASGRSKSIIFNSGSSAHTFNPPGPFDPSGQLPGGITIQNTLTITFNSLGEPTIGGGGSVRISAGGETKTIRIENYTGKVTIQ